MGQAIAQGNTTHDAKAMHMELSQLEYFRVLGRVQHVTRAADELEIAQPTLSRAITRLETELGVPLFVPLGRSVTLSSYGTTFLAFVERSLDELRHGRLRILELSSADSTAIPLGFSRSLAARFIPDLTRRFRLQYPQARFLFTDDNRDRLGAHLLDGQIALCITEVAPENWTER